MAKVVDKAKNMLGSLGAVQTLVENFPMSLLTLDGLNFNMSFDVLTYLFKMLGIDNEDITEAITNAICGGFSDAEEGSGFLASAESIVKIALETNIVKVLNCSTNPIISNNLLDKYNEMGLEKSGEGFVFPLSSIDYMGYLKHNPCDEFGSKFYFDVEGRIPKTMYASTDFNAYLWYVIHKGDDTQTKPDEQGIAPVIWDNRYRAKIFGKGNGKHKEIIKCTYVDETYPMIDKLKVQLCGSNYYRTRHLNKKNEKISLNKTIFEFNHEYLSSIRLYDPKVIVTEITDHMFNGAFSINANYSIEETIINKKIEQIITKIIKEYDTEVNDCYFKFSNEEYDKMLEDMELSMNSITKGIEGDENEYFKPDLDKIIKDINNIKPNGSMVENKTTIKNVFNDITAVPAQNEKSEISDKMSYDYKFELMRMTIFPFVRPIFTPKIMLLLKINEKIMGGVDDYENFKFDIDSLIDSLYFIIKDIVIRIADMLMDIFMTLILEKLRPLLELFASRLLMETIQSYKEILVQCYESCFNNNDNSGIIDNVNYADIDLPKDRPYDNIC